MFKVPFLLITFNIIQASGGIVFLKNSDNSRHLNNKPITLTEHSSVEPLIKTLGLKVEDVDVDNEEQNYLSS